MLYTGSLQKKITDLSNIYYNRGLKCCNENRISEAVEALRESLEFDKKILTPETFWDCVISDWEELLTLLYSGQ